MVSGGEIVRVAQQHLGERYVLGAKAHYEDPNFKGPWDCAEFASWCLFRATNISYGVRKEGVGYDAYSGYWTEDAHKLGTVVRWQEAAVVPGAFLIRSPGTHAEHPSGHVVICRGQNQTLEAMDTRHGVVQGNTTNRLWDLGVLVPGVDYGKAALSQFPKVPLFSLRAGNPAARGPLIRRIGQRLSSLGHNSGELTDLYSAELASAVARFQESKGLVADGEVGKRTYTRLFPVTPRVTVGARPSRPRAKARRS
ncbi:MAG: peptidoglycan-binding protein [Proteobacteria bacterium]|nr:peptidoglycan-binding protein [Pseudomonadota bacterium]